TKETPSMSWFTPLSDTEARASTRKLRKPGWCSGIITEAVIKISKYENQYLEATVVIRDADGEMTLRDGLRGSKSHALKLRSLAFACHKLDRYEAGLLGPEDIAGVEIEVRLAVQKARGDYPARNIIE